MKEQKYQRIWNYKDELLRRDAPSDGIGKWLEDQTIELAYRETGMDMVLDRTELTWCGDEPIFCKVTLKQRFA